MKNVGSKHTEDLEPKGAKLLGEDVLYKGEDDGKGREQTMITSVGTSDCFFNVV
jgi:hypothetical protein